MQAQAIHRYVGTSPRKMRLVIDLIRGKAVEEALTILHFTSKHAAKTAEMVLRSAISNIQNKEEGGRVDSSTLFVKEAFVDVGPTMKRVLPAPQGRAFRVRKRSNHVTIVVEQRAPVVQAERKPAKAVEAKPKKSAAKPAAVKKRKPSAKAAKSE